MPASRKREELEELKHTYKGNKRLGKSIPFDVFVLMNLSLYRPISCLGQTLLLSTFVLLLAQVVYYLAAALN